MRTLAAQSYAPGAVLISNQWGGDASACGSGPTCTITMNADKHITVTGNPA